MKKPRAFPFEAARRLKANEAEAARKAIERKLGTKRPRRGLGYQTVINEVLLKATA